MTRQALFPAVPSRSFHEEKQHGTLRFPCSLYTADARQVPEGSPFVVYTHWHRHVEVLHCEKGTFRVGVNMDLHEVEGDSYLFIGSGVLHSIHSDRGYLEQAVLFDPRMFSTLENDASEDSLIEPLIAGRLALPLILTRDHPAFGAVDEEYGKIRSAFMEEGSMQNDMYTVSSPSSQLRIRAAIMNILAALADTGSLRPASGIEDERSRSLKQVVSYIQSHSAEKIYVRDLAGIMNMNEQYFCRFFKKAVGRTPIAYINEVRVRGVTRRLVETDDPVSLIAEEAGFVNMGNFIDQFRRITGITPAEYRKRQKTRQPI